MPPNFLPQYLRNFCMKVDGPAEKCPCASRRSQECSVSGGYGKVFETPRRSDTEATSGLHDELQISRGASALNPNTAEHHLSLQRMSFMTAGSRVLDMQLTKLLGRLNDGDRQV